MMKVGKAIREKYPKRKIMVAGDIGNGEETARKVAKEIKSVVVFPRFKTKSLHISLACEKYIANQHVATFPPRQGAESALARRGIAV